MKTPHIINISPNRKNLRFSVQKYSKSDMHKQLDWLVELVKNVIDKSTEKIPKTIIFCNSLKDIAVVLNYLLLKLGLYAYGRSWPHCKEQIQQSMKQDGIQRIIVASSALSMGVDFPNIRYVINWGPARSLIEQHQEAGRAGRDGAQSHIVICYHGNQLSKCDEDVKNIVKTEGCFRVAAYKPFDKTIAPLTVHHNCCSNCARNCSCQRNGCNIKLPFEDEVIGSKDQVSMTRVVTQEDQKDVENAFLEVFKELSSGSNSFGLCHGFSGELVNSIVENCHKLFTIDNIASFFSQSHFKNFRSFA
jgi:superfamily II DNA helicase RecQ